MEHFTHPNSLNICVWTDRNFPKLLTQTSMVRYIPVTPVTGKLVLIIEFTKRSHVPKTSMQTIIIVTAQYYFGKLIKTIEIMTIYETSTYRTLLFNPIFVYIFGVNIHEAIEIGITTTLEIVFISFLEKPDLISSYS